ncbi:MAG: AbrB/MazE/SpoVT family DNA-binding domain-containing protein [Candidatus Woesearchaeota archaeon]
MKLTRKLQKTNKDQFTLTIPKALVQILDWKDKDVIEFGLERGKITITKAGKRGSAEQSSAGLSSTGKRGEKSE